MGSLRTRTRDRRGATNGGSSSRTIALLVAVLLAGTALAGCMDSGTDGLDGEAMRAEEGRQAADAEASAWADDPDLVEIATLEAGEEGQPEDMPDSEFSWPADESVGDGLVYAWKYTYRNAEGEPLNVIVNAEGQTDTSEDVQTDSDSPIGEWEIDSTEAVEAASEDEAFDEILEAEDATVLYALIDGGQDEPGWLMQADSSSSDEQRTILVNAMTGETQPFPGQG